MTVPPHKRPKGGLIPSGQSVLQKYPLGAGKGSAYLHVLKFSKSYVLGPRPRVGSTLRILY